MGTETDFCVSRMSSSIVSCMRYLGSLISISAIGASLVLCFISCNIFNPSEKRYGKLDADGYIQEGQKHIRDGDFNKALKSFNKAVKKDSTKSEAYYGIAKTHFLQAGFSVVTLLNAFGAADSSLPFFDMPVTKQDTLYKASRFAKVALRKIVVDSMTVDREIKAEWVKLDYAVSVSIYAVLRLKDLNGDSAINDKDNLLKFLQIRIDSNGVHMANMDSILATPEGRAQFNSYLENASDLMVEAYQEIDEMFPGATDSLDKHVNVEKVVTKLSDEIKGYKVGDGIDNDGDWWDTDGDGKMTPMQWTDLDGDGRIDLDFSGKRHIACTYGIKDTSAATRGYIRLNQGYYALIPPAYQAIWPKANGQLIYNNRIVYLGQPSGEWIDGDFGVDEEDYGDLKDADGDMRFDEDSRVKVTTP